ncbi:MAG: SDR family oxidoreductase [Alphaproteobacteria bacterium]|nr:SDR family oxidoreductase [Alphaproteobacteria bacterium]
MAGKRGLILGVANDKSIAWGVAKQLAGHGAELAFTYQNDAFAKRVVPLAESVGSDLTFPCDVSEEDGIAGMVEQLGNRWDRVDFVLHAVAYSDKNELKGRYLDTSRDNFQHSLSISCYSFTELARHCRPLMTQGGSLVTLTYLGANRVTPNYNVMGVAKAALEASVRYLAVDLGGDSIRVNAISAGPMKTLAGSAIADARHTYRYTANNAPLRRNVSLDEVGNTALYLASDLSAGVTGEVMYVDAGFNVTAIPHPNREQAPE